MKVRPEIDLNALQAAAVDACALLKVMSNPDRMLLLCHMAQGEYCVGELEALTGIRQPTLSQQLAVLRDDSLVATRRDGKQIYYSIASRAALAVIRVLYDQFCNTEKGKKS
jgi:DNA-binding transcriptional ArsR family regulator